MKRRIRLTEGELRNIIKKSVSRILREGENEKEDWKSPLDKTKENKFKVKGKMDVSGYRKKNLHGKIRKDTIGDNIDDETMKKLKKLHSENYIRKAVRESVNRVLNEISFEKAQAAYQASQDPNRPLSPAMQRRMAKNPMARSQQMGNLKQGASNAFNRDYGYNLKNVPFGSGDDSDMGVADPNKSYYGGGNLYRPFGDSFETAAGKVGGPLQNNSRTLRNWGNNPDEYDERGINVSTKDKIMNPRFAQAVQRGERALDNTIRRQ